MAKPRYVPLTIYMNYPDASVVNGQNEEKEADWLFN